MALEGAAGMMGGVLATGRARLGSARKARRGGAGNYAYVTARVRAKRAFLLPRDTYDRILMMELPEVARLLGEGQYKDEMVALGGRYSGVDLIESALARNLGATYTQILDFSKGGLRDIIELYLGRYDMENVKAIVRAKAYGAPAQEIDETLVAAGSLDEAFLRRLAGLDTLDDVFNGLPGSIYSRALQMLGKRASEISSWADWEDLVSRLYYQALISSIPRTTQTNRLLRAFVAREIDVLNLKTLLRSWAAKSSPTREVFIEGGATLKPAELHDMMRLERDELQRRLSEHPIGKEIASSLAEYPKAGIGELMRAVERAHLKQAESYGHDNPLSVLPVLDFILRKDREVQNLRIIARGKESGLTPDAMRALLVV